MVVTSVEIERNRSGDRQRYLAIDDYGRLINPMLTMGQVRVGRGAAGRRSSNTRFTTGSPPAVERLVYGLCPAARRRPAAARITSPMPTAVNLLGVRAQARPAAWPHPEPLSTRSSMLWHRSAPACRYACYFERIWRAIRSARQRRSMRSSPTRCAWAAAPSRRRCGHH